MGLSKVPFFQNNQNLRVALLVDLRQKSKTKPPKQQQHRKKKMKGQCCSLPLPLRNPIGTDFLSNLRVQPRLFLRSHSSHTQPIQFSGPVLCFCDTSFARFCSSDMPGPGVFGWWRMEVCFPVPVNLLSALRSHPGYKLGA